jgi:hypothetical protein
MDEFLSTWKTVEPVPIKEFASRYFEWCDAQTRPRTKVNVETLTSYGVSVVDGKVVGIPKKSVF